MNQMDVGDLTERTFRGGYLGPGSGWMLNGSVTVTPPLVTLRIGAGQVWLGTFRPFSWFTRPWIAPCDATLHAWMAPSGTVWIYCGVYLRTPGAQDVLFTTREPTAVLAELARRGCTVR
jgi:hypothetical protein